MPNAVASTFQFYSRLSVILTTYPRVGDGAFNSIVDYHYAIIPHYVAVTVGFQFYSRLSQNLGNLLTNAVASFFQFYSRLSRIYFCTIGELKIMGFQFYSRLSRD